MHKKKILVLTSTFPRWTNDTVPPFVFELSKRLAQSFDVSVLAPHYPGSATKEDWCGLNIRRFRYCVDRFETLAGENAMLPSLRRKRLNYLLLPCFLLSEFIVTFYLVKRHRVECIHAHWLLPQGLIAALVNLITGVPFLVTAHGGDVYGLQGRLASAFKRFTLKRAARVSAVSRDLASRINELAPGLPVSVIPMGVDATAFRPDCFDQVIRQHHNITGKLLLFVGRLSEKKGVRYLLEAMPRVLDSFPDVKLMVIGKGELEADLLGRSKQLALGDKVIFMGSIPNCELPAYYATADIFIGPSITAGSGDTEGFGLTFVEAGMSGCLVIGTRTGGIGDIVEDGETGFLVAEKDSEALSQTIIKVLTSFATQGDLRRKARQRLESEFDWQIISDKYGELLENI